MELSQPIFEIIEKKTGEIENGIIEYTATEENQNRYGLSITVLIVLVLIFLLIVEIKKSPNTKKNIYRIELHRLLRKYGDIIVEIKHEISLKDTMIIEVKDFNELLDVEEEIREPILFFEQDQYCVFMIIHHKIIYQWKLKKE